MILCLWCDDDRFARQGCWRSIPPPRRAPRHRRSRPRAGAQPIRLHPPTARRRDRASRRPWRVQPRGSSRRNRRQTPDFRDSGGTASPSAPAAPICRRRSDLPPAYGRHRRHAAKTETGWPLRSAPKNNAGAPRCSSRCGPAQTADNGIMCARLSVETGGWRTLA